MTKNKTELSKDEQERVKRTDKLIERIVKIQEALESFKLGDVFLRQDCYGDPPEDRYIHKNALGFPDKFKIIHVSSAGVPWMKVLNSNGEPTGYLELPDCVEFEAIRYVEDAVKNLNNYAYTKLIPDPDALDAILLQEEFQPMAPYKEQLTLFKDITKHNKSIAIETSFKPNSVAKFFKSLKPGDTFWTSPVKVYVFQSLRKVARNQQITALNIDQVIQTFNFSYFSYRRLYSAQPRSFAQERKA